MRLLVNSREMKRLDRLTIQRCGVTGDELMARAGAAVAEVCEQRYPSAMRIGVVCGMGNNGGDGFVAARLLASEKRHVSLFVVGAIQKLQSEALCAYKALQGTVGVHEMRAEVVQDLVDWPRYLGECDVVLDGLIGTGLREAVRSLSAGVIDLINAASCSVIAIDIPSGVCSDTGAVLGAAVSAHCTVAFAFPKVGHHCYPGAFNAGEVLVADIGIPKRLAEEELINACVLTFDDGPAMLPKRGPDCNKGDFGHLSLWAGSAEYGGAAVLAQEGALRSGAGLVSWVVSEETRSLAPTRSPEVMLRISADKTDMDWPDCIRGATAILAGPGLTVSKMQRERLSKLLEHARVPLCLDADALNIMAAAPSLWAQVHVPVVVTPHPKEMARLLQVAVGEVQADRLGVARGLAAQRQCVVVLKGARTVVASPDGSVAVMACGNAGLATGGSGDVLAGIIASFLAQGLDAALAARLGALLHGAAADVARIRRGEAGLLPRDVLDAMGQVLALWER